jgi:hypothetical protein
VLKGIAGAKETARDERATNARQIVAHCATDPRKRATDRPVRGEERRRSRQDNLIVAIPYVRPPITRRTHRATTTRDTSTAITMTLGLLRWIATRRLSRNRTSTNATGLEATGSRARSPR